MGENTCGLNWSDERVAELRRLFYEGRNKVQIAKTMGTTRDAVSKKMSRLGLNRSIQFQVWTDERVEELKRLFDEKLSASETAAKMGGGLTRLSIIGKWHRLGLKRGRKDTYRRPVSLPQARKPTVCSVSRWSAFSIESKPDALPPEPIVDVIPLHISLDELNVKTCRWPYGKGPYTFCGCDVVSGPYCVAHAAKAYEKRPVKKRPATKVLEREAA